MIEERIRKLIGNAPFEAPGGGSLVTSNCSGFFVAIECELCATSIDFIVWFIVDGDARPDLLELSSGIWLRGYRFAAGSFQSAQVLLLAPGAQPVGFCKRNDASAVSAILSLWNNSYRAVDMAGGSSNLPVGLNLVSPGDVLDGGPYGGSGQCELLHRDPASGELASTDLGHNGVATRSFGIPPSGWIPVGVGYGIP